MNKLCMCMLAVCLLTPLGMAQNPDEAGSINLNAGARAPNSLTTLFAANGGFRGNMIDITPDADLVITAIDVNVDPAGLMANVDVWYYVGSCIGHDKSQTGWKLLDSGSAVAAGYDLPTNIPLPNGSGVVFAAGQTYGLYIDVTSYPTTGINYTNGQNTFSNAELTIQTLYGKGTPSFTGGTFFPRMWNGTIYYDTTGTVTPLIVDVKEISSLSGGIINFKLNATAANKGRNYALIAGISGTAGFNLPGGLNVPVTWDMVTTSLLGMGWGLGTIDPFGVSQQSLVIPRVPIASDVTLSFAFFLEGQPWDFVSNGVDVLIKGYIPPIEYSYDDGTIESSMTILGGGYMCWMNYFDSGPGDTITSVSSAFGDPNNPGASPVAGTPITVAIWDDVNNDGDPSDARLLGTATGVIANPDTNILNKYVFSFPIAVTGKFIVGCVVLNPVGHLPCPMDWTAPHSGFAWISAAFATPGFNYGDLSKNVYPPSTLKSNGYYADWLLRAQN